MKISKYSIAHYGVKLAWLYEFKGFPADPFTLEQLNRKSTSFSTRMDAYTLAVISGSDLIFMLPYIG
jgi:hypothetical protein